MTRAISVGILSLSLAASAAAQAPPGSRILGRSIGGGFHLVPGTQISEQTVTLKFGDSDDRPDFTVEFVTRIAEHRPAGPGVVDLIVTQLQREDDAPVTALQVDGQTRPMPTRLKARRSIASTMSFDDFVELTRSATLIERAFDTDLVFSAGQLRILRSIVASWTRQAQP
jgi:hypothetical protein